MRQQVVTATAIATRHPDQLTTVNGTTAAVSGVILPSSVLLDQVEAFLRSLNGRNVSPATLIAYRTDLYQLVSWLQATYGPDILAAEIQASDIEEYLDFLARRKLSGVSRARKLAPIREFFRYLVRHGVLERSPAETVETPKKERGPRIWLASGEYNLLLSEASAHPRDVAILQLFLQTGVRVAELCDLRLGDVDFAAKLLRVRGKGGVGREIPMERKAIQAVRSWLKVRPLGAADHLFLNQYGEPLSDRGVRKLIAKYTGKAGITKRTSPHTLRRTFATHKSLRGVPLKQIQDMLGHANLKTTSDYIGSDKVELQRIQEVTSL